MTTPDPQPCRGLLADQQIAITRGEPPPRVHTPFEDHLRQEILTKLGVTDPARPAGEPHG